MIKYFRVKYGFSKSQVLGLFSLMMLIFFTLSLYIIISNCLEKKTIDIVYEITQPINSKQEVNSFNNAKIEKITTNKKKEINDEKITKSNSNIIGKKETNNIDVTKTEKFDINKVNIQTLIDNMHLSHKTAETFIKYRDKLGGFINVDQINDVYGLKKSDKLYLSKIIFITPDFKPQQIKINQASFKQIVAHPYISYKSTCNIVNFIKKHGPISSFDSLLTLLDEDDKKHAALLQKYISLD